MSDRLSHVKYLIQLIQFQRILMSYIPTDISHHNNSLDFM